MKTEVRLYPLLEADSFCDKFVVGWRQNNQSLQDEEETKKHASKKEIIDVVRSLVDVRPWCVTIVRVVNPVYASDLCNKITFAVVFDRIWCNCHNHDLSPEKRPSHDPNERVFALYFLLFHLVLVQKA